LTYLKRPTHHIVNNVGCREKHTDELGSYALARMKTFCRHQSKGSANHPSGFLDWPRLPPRKRKADALRSFASRHGGAIGGGVITYTVNGAQKIAVAAGYVSSGIPAEIRRAKITILGLEGGATGQ
jgi:hypothetical protein